MSGDNPLYYFDTTILLAWIKNETHKRTPEEMDGIRELFSKVHKGEARFLTSIWTKTEILDCTLTQAEQEKYKKLAVPRKNFHWADDTARVQPLTTELRDYYKAVNDGLPTLTVPDCIHLATAIIYKADIFYTFDERDDRKKNQRGLIPLSGNVANKYPLIICKPFGKQTELF